MNVVIVEDEMAAAVYLAELLLQLDAEVNIIQVIHTVKDAIIFFHKTKDIDLIFMDIELSDGLSVSIFKQANISCPVIFTTGHREYAFEAFKLNGIEYLLKPITEESLQQALKKYNTLQKHISTDALELLKASKDTGFNKKVLVAKKGIEFCLLKTNQVVCLYSENFIVFALDAEGKKYIIETTNLTTLEEELDPAVFFRANRKYLINIDFIRYYKVTERVKLLIEMTIPVKDPITIGQERSKEFKRWLRSL